MENAKSTSIFNRIWVYSKEEAKRLRSMNSGISATNFKLGKVVTEGGVEKPYTSIVRDVSQIRESDAVIVASGDMRKIHSTQHVLA